MSSGAVGSSTVGRPGGADLDLGGAALVGHPAEALGGDAGDGAGRGGVRRAVRVERLGQPGPADVGEHRVGDQLEVDLGAGVGDAAEGAVPGVVAGGVVQQDDPAGADVVVVDGHVGATAPTAYGAIRCGAGISSQKTSGRSRAARMLATASRNSGGLAPAPVPGCVS